MSAEGRTYTAEERAEWERDNTLPLPVIRLNVLRHQRRAREIAAERARQVAERRAARETP